jgi:hypothetical protein
MTTTRPFLNLNSNLKTLRLGFGTGKVFNSRDDDDDFFVLLSSERVGRVAEIRTILKIKSLFFCSSS